MNEKREEKREEESKENIYETKEEESKVTPITKIEEESKITPLTKEEGKEVPVAEEEKEKGAGVIVGTKKIKKGKKEKHVEKIKNKATKRKLEGEEKRLFKIAAHIKSRKPKFLRQQYGMVMRLDNVWRKPKGIDSKMKVEKRGQGHLVKIGYKKPESIRGIHPSGYWAVRVHNTKELENVNKEIQAAIISKRIGRKKRNEIIKKANELNIVILNPRKKEI